MQSMYVASKFALEGLSESLHYELACQGVDVTLVEPGGFRTSFAGNLKWPQDSHESTSIYKDQLRGFRSYLEKISKRGKGRDPSVVAELVFALANAPRAPIRRRIGSDSHAVYYLRRALPEFVGDRLFKNIAGKIIEAR
jgi:NAD(P)-dependent dehydrogenase (short-subunit alcohol dehydrogenase family)